MTEPTPAHVTPEVYQTGALKQDPETKASAVRTNIFDPDGLKDWGVMTVDRGGHYASWDEIQEWEDMAPAEGQVAATKAGEEE